MFNKCKIFFEYHPQCTYIGDDIFNFARIIFETVLNSCGNTITRNNSLYLMKWHHMF